MDPWEEQIKACGKAIIDNADKISGDYPYQTSVDVSFSIGPEIIPEIKVVQRFAPKDIIEKSVTFHLKDNT